MCLLVVSREYILYIYIYMIIIYIYIWVYCAHRYFVSGRDRIISKLSLLFILEFSNSETIDDIAECDK